jgi:hypothetical protein
MGLLRIPKTAAYTRYFPWAGSNIPTIYSAVILKFTVRI